MDEIEILDDGTFSRVIRFGTKVLKVVKKNADNNELKRVQRENLIVIFK